MRLSHKLTVLHVDIFEYLVWECKCDPMSKVSNNYQKYSGGGIPLHFAAFDGHLSMVKHILESDYGIDAEIETNIGTTPLQCAVTKGHFRYH